MRESCLSFIEFLKDNFEIEKVILVEMYLCEKYVNEDGEKRYHKDEVLNINKILFEYYSFFKENLQGIKIITVPERFNYTDANFKYGCKPFYLNSMAVQKITQKIYNEKYTV